MDPVITLRSPHTHRCTHTHVKKEEQGNPWKGGFSGGELKIRKDHMAGEKESQLHLLQTLIWAHSLTASEPALCAKWIERINFACLCEEVTQLGLVAQSCHSSYLGSWDRRVESQSQPGQLSKTVLGSFKTWSGDETQWQVQSPGLEK